MKSVFALALSLASSSALRLTSDPICNSSGCTQYLHPHRDDYPINYFVPDFGKDHDLTAQDKHVDAAEARLGHVWTPYQEENDDGEKEWKRIPEVFTLNGRFG